MIENEINIDKLKKLAKKYNPNELLNLINNIKELNDKLYEILIVFSEEYSKR